MGRSKDSIRWKVNSSALFGRGHREGQESSELSLWVGDGSASKCASRHLSLLEGHHGGHLFPPPPPSFLPSPTLTQLSAQRVHAFPSQPRAWSTRTPQPCSGEVPGAWAGHHVTASVDSEQQILGKAPESKIIFPAAHPT